ncbi:hypothetical protein [Terriglobus aquaticus]|uniref:Uncharacterized protein n=1 Tax=Terriglobus aquaticus TaxID=940139 RepID=A0ABW9KGD1_9BACT|nr:hypothetical protein [Terriglobus aquaticus]
MTADNSQLGKGNWANFSIPMEQIQTAAQEWRETLKDTPKPWLCWHVSDRWCALQQNLIQYVGWTPVIGFDPRMGPPKTVLPGSIVINFNEHFGLDVMWPHFPMEFAHLFTERLAFWHADLLCRLPVMEKLRDIFNALPDGAIAAVPDYGGRRNWLRFKHHRYWELAGCTTRGASQSQFDHGTGWWRHMAEHPSVPNEAERKRRRTYYYDSGVGIMFWKRKFGGKVVDIPNSLVNEGHCTSINRKNYKQVQPGGPRNLGAEIDMNFDIEEVARQLGIAHLLPASA